MVRAAKGLPRHRARPAYCTGASHAPRPEEPRSIHDPSCATLLGLLAVAGWGCTTVQQGGPQRTALMEATGGKYTAADLRAMSNLLAISVPGIIEAAANDAGAQGRDPATRRRALLWKIEVIPAFYQALFYSDSLAAALDAWSLSIQLDEAVTTGAWRDQLGAMQPAAVEATRRIGRRSRRRSRRPPGPRTASSARASPWSAGRGTIPWSAPSRPGPQSSPSWCGSPKAGSTSACSR